MNFANKIKNFFSRQINRIKSYFHFLHEQRRAKVFFWISLTLPLLLVLVFIVILPLTNTQHLPVTENIAGDFISMDPKSINQLADDALNNFSQKMVDLNIDESYLKAHLIMAKSDSINLSINLIDSTISLFIRGVNIRECKVNQFAMSHIFRHLKSRTDLFPWLAEPFVLQQEWSTLPKVPIKIRQAPKDTIEAQRYKSEVPTLKKMDVFFTLQFDRHLLIKINQQQSPTFVGALRKLLYRCISSFKAISSTLSSLSQLKKPQHLFWIELYINQNDANAIYHALPRNANLAFKF